MIRSAKSEEAKILTRISFTSKGYWNYPREYFDIWKNELTISAEYIIKNNVFVFENGGMIHGYFSIVELLDDLEISGICIPNGWWLEHMFLEPGYIRHGIGTTMFRYLQERCKMWGIAELGILADPNARGFYEKMGCAYMGEYPSTIRGRTTPYLRLHIRNH